MLSKKNNKEQLAPSISNFGDFEVSVAVQPIYAAGTSATEGGGYGIPWETWNTTHEDAGTWVLGEDEEEEKEDRTLLTDDSTTVLGSSSTIRQPVMRQDEEWGVFDPDAAVFVEEEPKDDDVQETQAKVNRESTLSTISEVELARRVEVADDSSLARTEGDKDDSSLLEKLADRSKTVTPLPIDEETPMELPSLDGEKMQESPTLPDDLFDLPPVGRESISVDLENTAQQRPPNDESIGGLSSLSPPRKRKKPSGSSLRKRRRIVIDNNETELTSEHIKDMLRDTSDLIKTPIHPASYQGSNVTQMGGTSQYHQDTIAPALLENLTYEQLLARPNIADDGMLHPRLLELYESNQCIVLGKTPPIRFRETSSFQEAAEANKLEEQMQESLAPDVERTRAALSDQRESLPGVSLDSDEEQENSKVEQRESQLSLVPPDDILEPIEEDNIPEEEQNFEMLSPQERQSLSTQESLLSLGAVNDLETEFLSKQLEDRQEQGSDFISSSSKWHLNTVKVLQILQREVSQTKDNILSYKSLTNGCRRRTASGFFFELLQLKTWDFIEVEQENSYGDILIRPGLRFSDPPHT